MILCTTLNKETAKYMRSYFKSVLENHTHSPSELIDYAKEYLKQYDFQHGSDLPELIEGTRDNLNKLSVRKE